MTTTVVLRPDALDYDDADWVNAGGAASKVVAVSDNTTATSIRTTRAAGAGAVFAGMVSIRFHFGTFVIPAGAQVRSVTPRIHHTADTHGDGDVLQTWITSLGADAFTGSIFADFTGVHTMTGQTVAPNGAAWTQAAIDDLRMRVDYTRNTDTVTNNVDVYALYLDVAYNDRPVVVVTAPAEGATLTTTNTPLAGWTYSDVDGDAQEAFQVKVFTAAQYGIGGFDPDSSPNTYDSGVVVDPGTTHQLPSLANGTYRVYVKVADATPVGYTRKWSLWDSNTFTINIVPPGVPVVAVTGASTALSTISGTVTSGTIPATGTGHRFLLQRSIDGGLTWTTVRGFSAKQFAAGTTGAGTVVPWTDYEVPRGATATYRARSTAEVGGQSLTSAFSAATAGTLQPLSGPDALLKSPSNPALDVAVCLAGNTLTGRAANDLWVFPVHNRREPVAHSGQVRAETFSVTFACNSDAEWTALKALVALAEPLLLQTNYGDALWEQFWVRLGNAETTRLGSHDMNTAQARTVTFDAVEVSVP